MKMKCQLSLETLGTCHIFHKLMICLQVEILFASDWYRFFYFREVGVSHALFPYMPDSKLECVRVFLCLSVCVCSHLYILRPVRV